MPRSSLIEPPFDGQLIGVATEKAIASPELKRWLLLFDKIIVSRLESAVLVSGPEGQYKKAELEWLAEREILGETDFDKLPPLTDPAQEKAVRDANERYGNRIARLQKFLTPDPDSMRAQEPDFSERKTEDWKTPLHRMRLKRNNADLLREMLREGDGMHRVAAQAAALRLRSTGIDAVAIHPEPEFGQADLTAVLSIVIPKMPIPSEDTSWEAILDFRRDPSSREKFVRLRRWATDLSTQPDAMKELNKRLQWMLYDYQQHMEWHRIKAEQSVFEVVVSASLELIINLPKALLGQVTKPFFALKKKKLELIEADLSAPGKEVAYIDHARQTFDDTK